MKQVGCDVMLLPAFVLMVQQLGAKLEYTAVCAAVCSKCRVISHKAVRSIAMTAATTPKCESLRAWMESAPPTALTSLTVHQDGHPMPNLRLPLTTLQRLKSLQGLQAPLEVWLGLNVCGFAGTLHREDVHEGKCTRHCVAVKLRTVQ